MIQATDEQPKTKTKGLHPVYSLIISLIACFFVTLAIFATPKPKTRQNQFLDPLANYEIFINESGNRLLVRKSYAQQGAENP
jgi:ABC-type spermidine/putrescine transport system permease subunit I